LYMTFSGFTDQTVDGKTYPFSCINGITIPLAYSAGGPGGVGAAWVWDTASGGPGSVFVCTCVSTYTAPGHGHISACDTLFPCEPGSVGGPNCGLVILTCSGASPTSFSLSIYPTSPGDFFQTATTNIPGTSVGCNPFCLLFEGITLQASYGGSFSPAESTGNITVSATPTGICTTPPITYTCSLPTNTCVAVYDGSGTYTSLSDCTGACGGGVSSYICDGGSCAMVGGTGGAYATLADCESACSSGMGGCPTAPTSVTASLTGIAKSCPIGQSCTPANFTMPQNGLDSQLWGTSDAFCGVGLNLNYFSVAGWTLSSTGGTTAFTATLVSGNCTGSYMNVVFTVSMTLTNGCTINCTMTFTS
jgi:hypothetical protein